VTTINHIFSLCTKDYSSKPLNMLYLKFEKYINIYLIETLPIKSNQSEILDFNAVIKYNIIETVKRVLHVPVRI